MKNAFTLPEMLVVVGLTAVVGTVLMSAIGLFYKQNAYVFAEASAISAARTGLTQLVQNIRQATYGADGSYPVGEATETSITVYADTAADGVVERIRYTLVDTVLSREVTEPLGSPLAYTDEPTVSVVAEGVRNTAELPLFIYRDVTGAVLAAPVSESAVRTVEIQIIVDGDTARDPAPVTLNGTATLRNRAH